MRHPLRIAAALLRVGVAEALVYRAQIIIWMLATTLPLVMLALWTTLAAEGPLQGYSEDTFIAYFLATILVRHLSECWAVWAINEEIRAGSLTLRLLRPLHPLWAYAGQVLGDRPLRLAIILPLVGLAFLLHDGPDLTADPLHWLAFPVAVAGAWLLQFAVHVLIGALAFWTEQSLALWSVWFGLWALLSGYLVPADLLPRWLQHLNAWLPFHAMLGLPVEIALGRIPAHDLLPHLALQAAWCLLLGAAALALWSRGVRRFEAYGA